MGIGKALTKASPSPPRAHRVRPVLKDKVNHSLPTPGQAHLKRSRKSKPNHFLLFHYTDIIAVFPGFRKGRVKRAGSGFRRSGLCILCQARDRTEIRMGYIWDIYIGIGRPKPGVLGNPERFSALAQVRGRSWDGVRDTLGDTAGDGIRGGVFRFSAPSSFLKKKRTPTCFFSFKLLLEETGPKARSRFQGRAR